MIPEEKSSMKSDAENTLTIIDKVKSELPRRISWDSGIILMEITICKDSESLPTQTESK